MRSISRCSWMWRLRARYLVVWVLVGSTWLANLMLTRERTAMLLGNMLVTGAFMIVMATFLVHSRYIRQRLRANDCRMCIRCGSWLVGEGTELMCTRCGLTVSHDEVKRYWKRWAGA